MSVPRPLHCRGTHLPAKLPAMSRPRRIVSLLPSATEMVYALGLGDALVGVSHECDYPPEARTRPHLTACRLAIGATSRAIDEGVRALAESQLPLYELDAERLAGLAPDLIITQRQCDVCAVSHAEVLEVVRTRPELRTTRVVALDPGSVEDMLSDIFRIGEAAGVADRARDVIATLRLRVADVRAQTQHLAPSQRPKVAALEWLDPLMAAGNWMPEVIELAGGRNGLAAGGAASAYVDWQTVIEYRPDLILVMPCGFDLERTMDEAQRLAELPEWNELAAVRRGQVIAVDASAYFNRCGPRLVDSLELLAHLLHPGMLDPPSGVDRACAWRRFDRA